SDNTHSHSSHRTQRRIKISLISCQH
uniref:Uncharacterized protein n=1 Tax=Amphimedon queenslandica TaxID=400682 RepID=A0A1X7SGD5_AMPQE